MQITIKALSQAEDCTICKKIPIIRLWSSQNSRIQSIAFDNFSKQICFFKVMKLGIKLLSCWRINVISPRLFCNKNSFLPLSPVDPIFRQAGQSLSTEESLCTVCKLGKKKTVKTCILSHQNHPIPRPFSRKTKGCENKLSHAMD